MKPALGILLVFLTAGLAFSTWVAVDLRKQQDGLNTKIAALESRLAESPSAGPTSAPARKNDGTEFADGAPTAGSPAGTPGSAPPADSDAPALRIGGTDGTAAAAPVAGGSAFNPATWTDADRAAFSAEVASALEAQRKEREARQNERQAEWMMARMKENLKLTDQQAQAIQQIVGRTMTAVDQLRESMTPDNREEIRPQIQTALQTAETEIKTYLTAEQVASYDTMKQGGGLWGGGGRGDRRPGRPEGSADAPK